MKFQKLLKKNIRFFKILLVLICYQQIIYSQTGDPPVAHINVEPSTTIEVGELVFFDASESTDDYQIMAIEVNGEECLFEWEFGDGYVMKIGEPYYYLYDYGICCVHYYMEPGEYTTTLTMTDIHGYVDTETVTITVTGEAPMEGFELWHAPYHTRIAQYIYAQIPESVRSNRLRVTLTGDNEYSAVLFDKSVLNAEEIFLLDHSKLPMGNYVLLAEILDGSTVVTYIREKFSKLYGDIGDFPLVGINENNAICINGEPFFPVTPWMLYKDNMPEWGGKYINTVYCEGYYDTHTDSTWGDYLDAALANNIYAIGPERFDGKGPLSRQRNSDINKIAEYVESYKDHEAMLMWMWDDEPSLGGWGGRIISQVLSAWTFLCHQIDKNHPVSVQHYGFGYLPYYGTEAGMYDYFGNEEALGKKHFPCDITGGDIYPLEFSNHVSLVDPNRGLFDLWVESLDELLNRNYKLIPAMQFIETQDIFAEDDPRLGSRPWTPGPTPEQLRMEIWLSVIHEMRGINWFHGFVTTPPENYAEMELFLDQITRLTPIILGPETERTITDNANERGKRVDALIRETDTNLYIFAARLTEPDFDCDSDNVAHEANEIVVEFNIEGVEDKTLSVFDEDRDIEVTNGVFSDTFSTCAVHIYVIPKSSPTQPIINVTPNHQVTFGDVEIGESEELTLTVTNVGAGILEGAASMNEGVFSIIGETDYTLAAGESTEVTIQFTSENEGFITDIVSFSGGQGAEVFISGRGVVENSEIPVKKKGLNDFSVYPNPAGSILVIESDNGTEALFELYNVSGIKVLQQSINSTRQKIDISKYPDGIYIYKIYNEKNILRSNFIIINGQ